MATPQNIGAPPPNANKISIVTKSEIRYEGILYHINPQDQNITLCNVKSFGTEGRRPGDEIAPSPQIHEYIIFRGSDIKDLKVIENAQAQEAPTTVPQQDKPVEQAPREQPRNEPSKDIKMGKDGNQEDFDFQAMQEKFHQFTLDHKQPDLKTNAYSQKDFFDSLSTSTADKTREIPFDRVAQKKTDKETFGSEYVDNATTRGRGGFRRGGGYRRGGGGGYRGGHGGQGGQNRGYGGGQNRYQQNRQGNYDNQGGNYGNQGGYGGHGGQGGSYGNQGGYGGHGGHGGQGGYGGQGRGGKYQSGPRYYKTYQTVSHEQGGEQQGGNEEGGFRQYCKGR